MSRRRMSGGWRLWLSVFYVVVSSAGVGIVRADSCTTDHDNTHAADHATHSINTLTDAEREASWRLLFDGQTLDAWRGYQQEDVPEGWAIEDGCLTRVGPGGDLITREQFKDFELSLEWKISEGGNSGIFFHVVEDYPHVFESGPEMQVLDNSRHPDGGNTTTSAGANYALHAPAVDATRPVGEFNHVLLRVVGNHVEHYLNGQKLLEYDLHSDDWKARVTASKFATMPGYGQSDTGHIALQDHGDKVWYRNIKIRVLNADDDTAGEQADR